MRKRSDSWNSKIHPGFLEVAQAYKECVKAFNALGKNPPSELVAEISARFREKMEGLRKGYAQDESFSTPGAMSMIYVSGLPGWPPTQREMDLGLLENLYWRHYREPLWIAVQKVESGDPDAYRKVSRVMGDYQRLRFNQGPVKSAKGDPDHPVILEMGLDMGLDELTSEELADFFDVFCPCGKSHDADALKKQRLRTRKSIRQAEAWLQEERAKIPTRERMAVYGKDGLAARGVRSHDGKTREVVVGVRRGPPPPKEGYFLADCRIREDGSLAFRKGSPFTRRSASKKLPAAFCVKTIKDLYELFFPS